MGGREPVPGVFLDLAPRAKLRVTGSDRFRYLNGQLTNDLNKASATNAITACLLNAKGKIDNYVFVSVQDDSFVIDSEPDIGGKLPARLERYIIADDVQLEDIGSSFTIFHVLGGELPELPKRCRIVAAKRFREAGHDIWLEN